MGGAGASKRPKSNELPFWAEAMFVFFNEAGASHSLFV